LCRASRVCCRRGVKILPREPTTLLLLLPKSLLSKVNSQLPSRNSPHRAPSANYQDLSNRKIRAASPPPLKHDGVTSRRSGAISQRHAHAPLASLHQPRVAHSRDTIRVLGPSREVNDCVRAVEQFPTYMRAPARARWQIRGSPASLMTRGCQGINAYYIVFANARFMYIAWELSPLLSNVETCSTSWSLRVSQARSLLRVTKIRIDPTLLSESMASLMDDSLTTSRARVQCRSSAMYRQKQLRQAGAGAAGGGGSEEKLCNED
jgi:hypothetical protein